MLIIFLALSLLAIFYTSHLFQKGVIITSVTPNSTASFQGFQSGEVINSINGQPIENIGNYSLLIEGIYSPNQTVKTTFVTDNGTIIYYSNVPPDITVSDVPLTNLKPGLDLAGGAMALVEAKNQSLTYQQASDLAQMISNRLNVYGLQDIQVSPVRDLSGNNYVQVEIAGATPSDIENLISQQGIFEAKIGNSTVFEGGKQDISSVGESGQNAGIQSCSQQSDGSYICQFSFNVFLSPDAAQREAQLTQNLSINNSAGGSYLSEPLNLYLDGKFIESLQISSDLKGRVTTQVSIQGSGVGATQTDAYNSAQSQMKQLQTILQTGSLPFQLEIVQMNTISPTLGKNFTNTILLAGFVALILVALVIFIRYKKPKASLALLLTSVSEIIIILGIAAVINWNLDLPSIAGILATLGTGVDSQIIILDEARSKVLNIKQRIKRAFAIIVGSYFTAFVAMLPLYWAVAGYFKGFAFTTIIGITVGILITRPAFADMVNKIEKD